LSVIAAPAGALVSAPGMARAHVRNVLAGWSVTDFSEIAELVVSELVTNVVRAATDADGQPLYIDGRLAVYQLGLFCDRAELLIEVFDTVPGEPVRRRAAADDESGRGLALVDALTTWGSFPWRNGKVVFARFPKAAEL
jgi:anti-sigma regulatory factor (Ser/Thr protein kinase)